MIRSFLNTGLVYEDEKYHNCVFVGQDNSGEARFASKRGTYDKDGVSFKRDVLGSDKGIAFPIPCDPAVPWVLVFEAPIDASGRNERALLLAAGRGIWSLR